MSYLRKRKIWAKIWILLTFLLVLGAQYSFYRFSMDSLNTFPISRGMTFGCTLWTTVLLGAMWLRFGWARYALIILICAAIVGFGAIILMLKGESLIPLPGATRSVIIGMVLYAAALVPLGASTALRHFLGPRTAGGH